MTTTETIEQRVPCTAPQLAEVRRLLAVQTDATQRLTGAVNLLVAGHVLADFHAFRVEADALVVMVPVTAGGSDVVEEG